MLFSTLILSIPLCLSLLLLLLTLSIIFFILPFSSSFHSFILPFSSSFLSFILPFLHPSIPSSILPSPTPLPPLPPSLPPSLTASLRCMVIDSNANVLAHPRYLTDSTARNNRHLSFLEPFLMRDLHKMGYVRRVYCNSFQYNDLFTRRPRRLYSYEVTEKVASYICYYCYYYCYYYLLLLLLFNNNINCCYNYHCCYCCYLWWCLFCYCYSYCYCCCLGVGVFVLLQASEYNEELAGYETRCVFYKVWNIDILYIKVVSHGLRAHRPCNVIL